MGNQAKKRGSYTVDFQCVELGAEVSVFQVKAYDAAQAERNARATLNPQFNWRCTAIDRVTDARD